MMSQIVLTGIIRWPSSTGQSIVTPANSKVFKSKFFITKMFYTLAGRCVAIKYSPQATMSGHSKTAAAELPTKCGEI
jgi:hypothetical protein